MMESLNLEEKEQNYNAVKDIGNLSRLKKKKPKVIKGRIFRDIKNLFEHKEEEENCHKPVRIIIFWSSNYIECKSNGDRYKRRIS